MKRMVLTCALAFLLAAPALAHHNYRLNYDDSKEITLVGVASTISWANPHITIYLDVTDADGKVVRWAIPTAAPGVARRNGFTSDVLKEGDHVTLVGWPARDSSLQMRARLVTLEDGTEFPLHPTDRQRNRDRNRND